MQEGGRRIQKGEVLSEFQDRELAKNGDVSLVVSSLSGYVLLGDAPHLIHRIVTQPFLPEFEAALPSFLQV